MGVRGITVLLAVFLVFSIAACHVSAAKEPIRLVSEDRVKENLKNQSGALGLAMAEIDAVEKELDVDLSALDAKSAWVIVGDQLNGPEEATLALAKANSPKLFENSASASKVRLDDVKKSDKLVILIGGPAQNSIANGLDDEGVFTGKRHEYMNQMVIATGRTNEGAKVVVLSDKRGFVNLPRKAAAYSPLALCLPLQLVPVAASLIGAAITSVLHPIISLVQAYLENAIAERRKKKMRITDARFKFAGIKAREVLSIAAAAFILGAAMTWTFAGPTWDFLWLMPVNMFICLVAGFSHEAVHWASAKLLKVDAEYKFWFFGSVTTLFSALMGNAFGLQGFLLDEAKEGTPKWKVGVMKLASPVFSAAVMVFFAAVNFFFPHVFFQMVYSTSGVLAMAEMLPFKPMDGYDIRRWSIIVWFAAFAAISACFVAVSFVI
jgi:hypothetical protein